MNKIIKQLVDFIYPRRCPVCHEIVGSGGELICKTCEKKFTYVEEPYCMKCGKPLKEEEKEYCIQCCENNYYFNEGRSVYIYEDTMRFSIYRFKYGNRPEYAEFYASEIYKKYKRKIKEWNADIIIPIPLHKSRLNKRGYNQAYLIAKELSKLSHIPTDENYLIRKKKTSVQKNLTASEREDNIKNAFKIKKNRVKLKSAILIDDIYTTGVTINEASKILKEAGFDNVYFICVSTGRG